MKKNYLHNFIFSNVLFFRIQRHLAFWLARLFCLASSQTIYHADLGDKATDFLQYFLSQVKDMPLKIISFEVVYCYAVIYYLVPKYLVSRKYRLFALSLSAFTVLILLLGMGVAYSSADLPNNDKGALIAFGINITRLFLIFGAPTVAVFFLAIKMFKTWYLKQQEKQLLLRANADAEIQLLKAQVHPHFLFNTLNNIYSFALDKSPRASELVLQLIDMMKYMVTECNAAFVPLENEITMIRNYVGLEKVRYGNQLNLLIEIEGDCNNKMIAPLLMIPFVENAFKHGASKMLDYPWVSLKIIVENDIINLKIGNNKSQQTSLKKNKNGIGIKNVEKRLKLLYPHQYVLKIESVDNVFSVEMQVPLKKNEIDMQNKANGEIERLLKPIFST